MLPDRPVDPGLQGVVAVIRQRQGLVAQQTAQTFEPRLFRRQARDVRLRAEFAQRVDVRFIRRIVDESSEEYPVPLREVPEEMEGAHLVALVGRIGQTMDEVEEIHGLAT